MDDLKYRLEIIKDNIKNFYFQQYDYRYFKEYLDKMYIFMYCWVYRK